MEDKRRLLYDALSNDYELGDFESFSANIADDAKRRNLYDAISDTYDVGDYESFSAKLGIEPAPEIDKSQYAFTGEQLGLDKEAKVPGYEVMSGFEKPVGDDTPVLYRPGVKPEEEKAFSFAPHREWTAPKISTEDVFLGAAGKDDYYSLKARKNITAPRADVVKHNGRYYTPEGSFDGYMEAVTAVDDAKVYNGVSVGQMKEYFSNKEVDRPMYARSIRKTPEEIESAYSEMNKQDLKGQYGDLAERVANLMEAQRVEDIKMHDEYRKNRGVGGFIKDAIMQMPVAEADALRGSVPTSSLDISKEGVYSKEQNDALAAAGRKLNEINDIIQAAESGNFFDAMTKALGKADTWTANRLVKDASTLKRVAEKYEKEGEESLTKAERALLEAVVMQRAVAQEYEDELTAWDKAGKSFGESVPFMIEMFVNPLSGLGSKAADKLGKLALKKIGEKGAKNFARRAAWKGAKALGRVAGGVVGGTGMAFTTGLPSLGAGVIERTTGDATYGRDVAGDIEYRGHENAEGLGTAIYKEATKKMLDNASEMIRAGYASAPFKWLQKAGKGTKLLGWIDNLAQSKTGKMFGEFMEKTKWNGPIEEFLEEVHVGLLEPALVGDSNLKDFFNGKNLASVAIAVAVPGVTMSAINTAAGAADGAFKVGAQERWKMQKAEAKGYELWQDNPNEWNDLTRSLMVGQLTDIEKTLNDVYKNERLSSEQKKAALEYAVYSLQWRTARGVKDAFAEGMNFIDPMLYDVYSDVYGTAYAEVASPKRADRAYKEMIATEERAKKLLGVTEGSIEEYMGERSADEVSHGNKDIADAITAYQAAKLKFEGVRDKFRDDKARAYRESDSSIEKVSNNGVVYSFINDRDEELFITDGEIVLNDNNTVDYDNSSEIVYVLHPNGREEQTTPWKIVGKITVQNAEAVKAAARADIDNEWRTMFDAAEMEIQQEEAVQTPVSSPELQDAENGIRSILGIPADESIEDYIGGRSVKDVAMGDPAVEEMLNSYFAIKANPAGADSVQAPTAVESGEMKDESAPAELPDVPDFFRLDGTNYEVASRNADGSVDAITDGKRVTIPAGTDYSSMMPTDKKGDIVFTDMPVERTHEYFVQKVANDKKRAEMIDNNRKKAETERKKYDKEPDAGLDPDKWEEANRKWEEDKKAAQAKIDYWNEVAKREAEITRSETREAVENINPDVVKETEEEFIASHLPKITPESFKRGTGLSNEEQSKLVGVISNEGVTIEQAAESIMENYDSELKALGFTGDMQDVRNVIIDVLSQGNPRSYAKNSREAREAENIEQQRAEAEAWAMGTFNMTLEELYVYEETLLPRLTREFEGFDEKEYYDNLAEIYKNDTTRESESIGRSGEVLQGEQSVPSSGAPTVGVRNERGAVSDDVQGGSQNGVAQEEAINEPVGETDNSTVSQTSDQVGGQVAEGEGRTESGEVKTENALGETDAPGQSGVYADNHGNSVDADGKLIVDEVNSIDEITDEDFETPTRNVQLPAIPENVANAIGTNGRPVVIKKNVFEKNGNTHVELEPEDSRNILRSALYNPNLVGSTQPIRRPDYKVAIRTGEQNAVVVLDVYQEKDFVEIVGWRMVNEKGLAKMQRQAEREGGQFLILSPNDGSAAALSALPLGLSSASEDRNSVSNSQENAEKSGEIAEIGGERSEEQRGKSKEESESAPEIQEPRSVEEMLDNGDKRITSYNSRGEVATVAIERDGKVIAVDSYDEGVLFEHTEYDGNGKATSVTRYDKQGNVVFTQKYVNGIESKAYVKETMRAAPLRKRAEKWMKETGVPVRLIGVGDEITNSAARRAIEAGKKVTGWIDNDEVVLYLPNIRSAKEIDDVFVHEVVAHKGLKALMGEDFNALCDKVWEMMSEEQRAYYLDYPGVNGNTRKAADEYMAHLAEGVDLTDSDKTIWDWIVDAVRAFLAKSGFKLSNRDIENLIKASYSNLRAESGKGKTGSKENDVRGDSYEGDFFNENDAQIKDRTMFRVSRTPQEFDATQAEAVEKRGIVAPGLNEAVVNVVNVPRHDFTGNLKEARAKAKEWAIENYTGKEFDLPENAGKYVISKNAIGKYLDKSAFDKSENAAVHLSVLKELPNVISNSIEAEIHADYSKGVNGERSAENGVNRNDLLVHRIYGAVNIDGKTYRVKTTIHEFRDANTANTPHSYEVTKIELIEDSTVTPNDGINNPLNRSVNSISATKLLEGVEKSYDKGKKVLDESENFSENPQDAESGIRFRTRPMSKEEARQMVRELVVPFAKELREEQETRFRTIGGNSGYVGYSMSKRAAEAREEGRYPKTDFKKEYGVTDKELKALVDAGIVSDKEWHHTSKFGNRTTFYGFENGGAVDFFNENRERVKEAVKNGTLNELLPEFQKAADAFDDAEIERYRRETQEQRLREEKRAEYNAYVKSMLPEMYTAENGVIIRLNGSPDDYSWKGELNGETLTKRHGKSTRDAAFAELREHLREVIPSFNEWAGKDSGIRFRFVGEKGAANLDNVEEATTRLDNLAVAHEMETAGKEAKAIKLATGWERGADGKWRYETEDALIKETPMQKVARLKEEYQPIDKEFDRLSQATAVPLKRGASEEEKARRKELNKRRAKVAKEWSKKRGEIWDAEQTVRGLTVADLIGEDNELLKAYPELADMQVSFVNNTDFIERGYNGFYDGSSIWINPNAKDVQSTFVHEIQHAVQEIEGFARGSNVERFADVRGAVLDSLNFMTDGDLLKGSAISDVQSLRDALDKNIPYTEVSVKEGYAENLQKVARKYGYENIDALVEDFTNMPSAFEQYLRTAGEVESRNVQERMNMTPEERRNSLAAETEDVARKDQIFIYDALKSAMNVDDLFAKMNENAEPIVPRLLTEEVWENEIRDKRFKTPIGDVKLGENQYKKNKGKGREREFGMIIPTLERPDFIFEEVAHEEGAERQTKYVFAKAFYDNEGNKHVYYADVSVLKDGMEAVTSSHHLRDKQVLKKIRKEQMLWNRFASDSMSSAQGGSTDQSNALSADKGSDNSSNTQEGETRFRTVEEAADSSIDDVPTQPMTLMERLTNSLLEVSAKNKENLDLRRNALRTFGRDLENLLKLMRAQREYDKSTVDTLVKLAKMYFKNAQLLGEVDTYTMGRVLSLINNVVGKRDVTASAAKLVDILLDAHTKALKGVLDKAEKAKAKKVNAAGVEVMGSLDKYAQEMTEVYKDAKGWDIKLLDESISESENRLAEADAEVRRVLGIGENDDIDKVVDGYVSRSDSADGAVDAYKHERARLEGFDLAREYREKIHHAEVEIATLKQELKDAETEYRSGLLNGKELKEFRKATQEAIMQAKAEMIEGYHDVIKRFTSDVAQGRTRAKAFVQEQIDRAREIQHNANSDMEGHPADAQGEKPDAWNNSAMRWAMSAMLTFQGMLKKFGEKAVDGKGYLYNRFMPQATQAADKEFKGKVAARLVIETELKRIFGEKMSIEEFLKLSREKGVAITYKEAGVEKSFELGKGQMLYIYMVNKMSDGKMKLRKMGITEELVEEIAGKLDPKMIGFADWVQNTLLSDLRGKYNAVHERMFGAPMAAIENYFPIKIRKEARGERGDVSQQYAEENISTVTGSIIKRSKNATALDLSADAMSVLIEHIDNMEHWAAFAEFNRDLNTLLNYRHFQNQVKNMTSVRYGSGDVLWRNFREVASIVAGTYRPSNSEIDKAVLNIAKGLTRSKINFRGYTALKQVLSAPAFWNEAGVEELAKCYANPMGSCMWAMENLPGFAERWKGRTMGNEKLLADDNDWKIWRTKFVENATKWGMTPNAAIDALTVAQGARAVYLTKLKKFKKAGYTEQRAHEKAIQAAAEAYNETQQSSEGAYISPLQVSGTIGSAIFSTFKNNNFGYTRKTIQAIANINRKRKKGYKEKAIEFMTKQMVRDGLTEEQAKRFATQLYNKSLYKDVADAALFGVGLGLLWEFGGSAIYLIMGDDDEEKEKLAEEIAIRGGLGALQGIPGGEMLTSAVFAIKEGDAKMFRLPQLVAVSDVMNVAQALDTDWVKGATDLINMFIAMGVGVNMQTFTDWYAAARDIDGATPEEIGMFVLRFLAAPQSQTEKLRVDDALEDNGERAEEAMRQYVEYKTRKATPLTGWMYSDEGQAKAWERYSRRFKGLLDERIESVVEDSTAFDLYYDNASPLLKEKLDGMRKDYLSKDKKEEMRKADVTIDDVVNNTLWGKNPKNEVYYGMTNSKDIDEDFLLKESFAKYQETFTAWNKLRGEARAEYSKTHKKELEVYDKVKPYINRMNNARSQMKTDPNRAAHLMIQVRRKRREAINLINNYRKNE